MLSFQLENVDYFASDYSVMNNFEIFMKTQLKYTFSINLMKQGVTDVGITVGFLFIGH